MFTKPPADSPYALYGEPLVEQGYHAIPCRPGSKRPGAIIGGQWFGRNDWQQYCDRKPTDYELRTWTRWPDAGICVALGNGVVAVDVDTDADELRSALASVLPLSYVQKRGDKGFTAFYRGSPAIRSAAFNINNQRVLDLLAHGKQTVVPPTIHPDTGRPYVWLTDETLLNTAPEDLPLLPDDIAEQIAAVLAPHGYAPQHAVAPSVEGYGHSIWREVNDRALADLDKWVPFLDLPKLKRTPKGFVAVPFWRPSNRGRPLHERAPNLKITTTGIMDFHDGDRGYTPLDVVMKALGCGLDYADDWLRARIGYNEPALYGLEPWFPKVAAEKDKEAASAAPPPPAQPQEVGAPRSTVDPFPPRSAGGLIEAVARWTLETGRRPVPEFAMMTAVAFAAGLYGRRFVGPTGVGLNVYLVGLGASALGKGHPLKALRTIANDCNMLHMVAAGVPTSDSAIERMLRKLPSQVLPLDEFGLLMQSVNGRNSSSWSQTVRRALLEVYSLSTDMWMGKQFSDPKRPDPEPLHCPTLTLMSVTTPTTFYDGLTEANLSDGFLNRMTVIHATEMPDRQEAEPIMTAPPSLVAAVKQAEEGARPSGFAGAAYRDPNQRPKMAAVPWATEEAKQRWLWIEDWQIAQIEERSGHEGIVGRAAEQTQKFATLRALSRDGKAARVTLDDVEWGYAIVQRSIDCLDRGIAEFMSGSEFEAVMKSILAALRRAKGGVLARSVLLRQRGVSKVDTRTVNGALDRLVETGEVTRTGQSVKLCA
ncbi:bifunctional DNA primase/polymerase [Bosea sp. NPDC055332]